MEKLYPSPKTFVDDSEPDLDAAYFNGVETGLSAIDERIVNLLVSTLTSTVAGQKALDAVVGKILNDKITKNAEAISSISSDFTLWEVDNVTFSRPSQSGIEVFRIAFTYAGGLQIWLDINISESKLKVWYYNGTEANVLFEK